MWVTLLILLYTERFVNTEFLACTRQTVENSKTRNLPAFFFYTMRTKVRYFFTASWQQIKCGCTIMNLKTNVGLWNTNINITFFTVLKLVLVLIHMSSLMLLSVVGSKEQHSVNRVANDSSSFTWRGQVTIFSLTIYLNNASEDSEVPGLSFNMIMRLVC